MEAPPPAPEIPKPTPEMEEEVKPTDGSGSAVDMGLLLSELSIREVLLNCSVRLIDEVAELIKKSGAPSLTSILDDLRQTIALQPGLNSAQRDAAEQIAIQRKILEYQAQYEEPAAAALRQHPPRSAAITKLITGIADKYFLDALELDFSGRHSWPTVSSLSLRVSPEISANKFGSAVIARADHEIIVMYFGTYRPCMHGPGFYLIYDAKLKTLAAAAQVPKCISLFSHRCIGSGAAVLRLPPSSDSGYVLVELLLRLDSNWLPTSNATLLTWSNSSSSQPSWVETEVVLPQQVNGYAFHADTVFPVGTSGLCWADLTKGILVCENLLAQVPEFKFISLPLLSDPLHGRGRPEESRCIAGSSCQSTIIRFAYVEGRTITMWNLNLADMEFGWKRAMCFDMQYTPDGPISHPLLSVVEDDVLYVDINTKKLPGYHMVLYKGLMLACVPRSQRVSDKIVASSSCFL
jgi:hypothetical protein